MRKPRIPGCVWILALLACAGCKKTKLDHFKFYIVAPVPIPATMPRIELKGQFDEGRRRAAALVELSHFGISVGKRRLDPTPTPGDELPPETPSEDVPEPPEQPAPPANPQHHLTWYKLDAKNDDTSSHYVKLIDQFGTKELITGPAIALLVPAQKIEGGSEQPKGLNHFKCYDVTRHRGAAAESVILQDQLDRPNVDQLVVKDPQLFCVPVEKYRGGRREARIEPNADRFNHLLLYQIEPRRSYENVSKTASDQILERSTLTEFRSQYLAVPADKRVATPGNQFPSPPG